MADDDLITEELKRVYRLYGEATRQFRRGLYALIVAGLTIFALIVVPFLTFRDQVARLEQRQEVLAGELQHAGELVADTHSDLEEAEEISNDFSRFVQRYRSFETFREMEEQAKEHAQQLQELRRSYADWQDEGMAAWVQGETKRPPEEIIRSNRRLASLDRPCYWQSGATYAACQLCETFKDRHRDVVARLSGLDAVEEATRQATRDDLEATVQRACGWLTRGEAHWRSDEPVALAEVEALRGYFTHDLHAYEQRMDGFIRTLRERLPGRELEMERLTRELDRAKQRLVVFEDQLDRTASFDRLGTPMGDLPVGVGQMVLLFPVVVALGFAVVANGYSRIAELWRAFIRLCRKRDRTGEVMDAEHIAVIAPLWLDPREPIFSQIIRWGIMLTPLALVAANLALVVTTEALSKQLPDDAVIPPVAYWVLYAASLALLVGALWHVWRIGRRLAEDGTSPAHGAESGEHSPGGQA